MSSYEWAKNYICKNMYVPLLGEKGCGEKTRALDLALRAIDRVTQKKAIRSGGRVYCPHCGIEFGEDWISSGVEDTYDFCCCYACGQNLDWSE